MISGFRNTAKSIENDSAQVIKIENLHVSVGWLDSSVSFGEPGYEERETIEHGALVASKSGFTDIILNPNTDPVLDKQTDISFVKLKSKNATCSIHPLGALSISSNSVDMAELFDMKNAGAVTFTDDLNSIENPMIMSIERKYKLGISQVMRTNLYSEI